MRNITLLALLFISTTFFSQQVINDGFEGDGTITNWFGDQCVIDNSFVNPFVDAINTSSTVLRYSDAGGLFANVRFDTSSTIDFSTNNTFTLKVYVPSSGITGGQTNKVSLKLQNRNIGAPWSTQSEIIKTITLDQWQTVTFDFKNGSYNNLDSSSKPPTERTDFNRVVIQVNGENNSDHVIAYIDDILFKESDGVVSTTDPVFDNLVWSDEFDGSGAIDSNKWHHQTDLPNGGSWYNGEVQHYTNKIDNSFVENGNLKIVAKKESFTDQGQTKQYTSARLNSKFAFTYGKIQVRAKLPTGVGTWPAIWMLGKNINEPGGYWDSAFGNTNWPDCGEVDIMEHWGSNQNFVQSAMHTPSSFGGTVNHGGRVISTASSAFHVYELIWTEEKMVFSVDGVTHYTYNPSTKNSSTWPFDAPQYMLLNIAVQSSISASFTQSAMEIDYVRVYQESSLSNESFTIENSIQFYPNPVKERFTIVVDSELIGKNVRVFSVLGREVKSFVLNERTSKIDFSDLNTGVYFLKIKSNGKSYTKKVVKI